MKKKLNNFTHYKYNLMIYILIVLLNLETQTQAQTLTKIDPPNASDFTSPHRGLQDLLYRDNNGNFYFRYRHNAGRYVLMHYDGINLTPINAPNTSIFTSFGSGLQEFLSNDSNGNLYFKYQNDNNAYMLMRYDGTNMTQINPPNLNDFTNSNKGLQEFLSSDANGNLYFRYYDNNDAYMLMHYDGTNMTQVNPPNPNEFTFGNRGVQEFLSNDANQNLYLRYRNNSNHYVLMRYDGTNMTQINPPNPNNFLFFNGGLQKFLSGDSNGNLYFQYYKNTGAFVLISYDGTNMIELTPPNFTDFTSSGVQEFFSNDSSGNLYFQYKNNSDILVLVRYDGTSLTEIHPPNSFDFTDDNRGVTQFLNNDTNGNIYFQYYNNNGTFILMRYDGTNLIPIDPINPVTVVFSNYGLQFFLGSDMNGNLYYQYQHDSNVRTLMQYDGTDMRRLSPPNPNDFTDPNRGLGRLLANDINGNVYFRFRHNTGREILMKYDGTNMTAINPPNPSNFITSGVTNLFNIDTNGDLYFRYLSDNNVGSLMRYDWANLSEIIPPNPNEFTNQFSGIKYGLNFGSDADGNVYASYQDNNNVSFLMKLSTPKSEINVQGNNTNILSGSTNTATNNDTDFGEVDSEVSKEILYTIQNTDAGRLVISDISSSNPKFEISEIPISIEGNSSETFKVTFVPNGTTSEESATITITNTDVDEGTYNFVIKANSIVSGLSDNLLSTQTKVYPNPTEDEVQVVLPQNVRQIQGFSIEDVQGRSILKSMQNIEGNYFVLSFKDLESSVYFLRIYTDKGKVVKRILKK